MINVTLKMDTKSRELLVQNARKISAEARKAVRKHVLKTAWQVHNDAKYMCVHPRTKVLTNDGWKSIKDVKTGDLVITETGEMKPVENIIKSKPSELIRIFVKQGALSINGDGVYNSITASPQHLIKVAEGWKRFEELKEGETIFFLASKCKQCGKLCHFKNNFCSRKCVGLWNYKYKNTKKNLDIGHVKARELAKKRDNKSIQKKCKEWRVNNPDKVKEYHKRQAKSLMEKYRKNPEKHPNAICARNHFASKLEKKVESLLKYLNIDYEHQFRVSKYWIDFALPGIKIFIECDGSRWHQNKEKDKKRDEEIKRTMEEWQIIHFSEQEINNLTPRGLKQYISYSLGDIDFIGLEIKKIKITKAWKYCPCFIDLVINGGRGTFIANGFLVHNCPVDTGRLRASTSVNWTDSGMARAELKGKVAESQPDDGVGMPVGLAGFNAVVGTNVEYSESVESRSPYLWPALAMNKRMFREGMRKILKGGLME